MYRILSAMALVVLIVLAVLIIVTGVKLWFYVFVGFYCFCALVMIFEAIYYLYFKES